MRRRLCTLVVFGIFMAVAASVAAAAPVTLILKSGDRVRGDLIDLNASGFVVRVNGAEQRFAPGDVVAITFTDAQIPAAETNRAQEGRALVVLHDGQMFYGSLADVGGTSPLRLSFRTPDGDRELNSDQVARIYFASWQGIPGSTGSQTDAALDPGGAGLTIPANTCWTNTGRSVRQGQRVTFNGSGEIQLSADQNDIAGVAGSRNGRTSPSAPIPGTLVGALIGRVGNSRPFGIGDQRIALGMPMAGQLFLGINDDHCGDNRGQFRVEISLLR
ncbi:MAG: hypothetical protein R6V57_14415 [Vicinamibacterales bacterium]